MSKSNNKPVARKAPTKTVKEPEAYAGHVPGSRKGDVHRAFDTEGQAAAFELGQKLGLKDGTLKSWFGVWRRENERRTKDGGKGKADKGKPSTPDKAVKALRQKAEEMKRKDGKPKGTPVIKTGTGKRQRVIRRAA